MSSADTALTSQDRSRDSHPRGQDGGSGKLHRGTDTDGAGEKDTERDRDREWCDCIRGMARDSPGDGGAHHKVVSGKSPTGRRLRTVNTLPVAAVR